MRGWGRVYVYFGTKGRGLAPTPDATIETRDDLTLLGEVLEVVNGSLFVGAPQSSFAGSRQPEDAIKRGAVFAFDASATRYAGATLDARRDADWWLEGPENFDMRGAGVSLSTLDRGGGRGAAATRSRPRPATAAASRPARDLDRRPRRRRDPLAT